MIERLKNFGNAVAEYGRADGVVKRMNGGFYEGFSPCSEQITRYKNACEILDSGDMNIASLKLGTGVFLTVSSAIIPESRTDRIVGVLMGLAIIVDAVQHNQVIERASTFREQYEYKR